MPGIVEPEMAEPAREARDLFEKTPDLFTSARNAVVKQLKSEGRKEEAAQVAKLRRPTATTWALNQLARRQPQLIQRVIDAGDGLRQAMEKVIAGDRSEFQKAQAAERAVIQEATVVAAGLLAEIGAKDNEATRRRLSETLRAATVDQEVADQLRAGALEADASSPGLGLDGLAGASRSDPPAGRASSHAGGTTQGEATDGARRRAHDAEIAKFERELAKATMRLARVQSEADKAAALATELEQRAADARREVEALEELLEQKRRNSG